MSKKCGIREWRVFLVKVEENLMYSQEEISALLNFYYEERKRVVGRCLKNGFCFCYNGI
jgi:hypothetical protein